MKTKFILPVLAFIALIMFNSCEEEIAKPKITLHELGEGEIHGNEHTVAAGSDLHIDAEIEAEGKIQTVQVLIHPEGEHVEGEHEEFEIDTTYTKFVGLKNAEFHEHIEIDDHAEVGEYHFDIIVTDQEGNQVSAERELEILAHGE